MVLNRTESTVRSTTRYVGHIRFARMTYLCEKIGACRHGDRCSRKHIKPPFSQTILLPNVYHNPAHDPICKLSEKDLQEGFDAVYEDLYCELAKFGHLLELHVFIIQICFGKVYTEPFCRCATTLVTISLATYMRDTNGKPKLRPQLIVAMSVGTQVRGTFCLT